MFYLISNTHFLLLYCIVSQSLVLIFINCNYHTACLKTSLLSHLPCLNKVDWLIDWLIDSYSSREDAKPSSGTSTLASCKEVSPRLVWSKIKNVNDRDEKGAFLFIFALYRVESGGWIFFVRRPKFLSRNGTFLQLNWRYLTSYLYSLDAFS